MVKLIRSNQKKFLAGFTILLTVTFLVQQRASSGNGTAADHDFATIGGKSVFTSEMVEARAELSAVKNYVTFSEDDRDATSRPLQNILYAMQQKQELFFLLRHEARALGVQVSNDDVLSVMVNHARDLQPDTDVYDTTREGVTDLLRIIARFEQVAGAIKISKPMVDHEMVNQFETIQANLVQLSAQDFLTKVPPPTTQEVQDQFNKFADSPPHHPNPTTNPFGFGYKQPMRAKLQYVRLTQDAATTAVVQTKSNYDWEVAANKYYLLHSDEFIPKPATTAPVAVPQIAPPLLVVHDQVLQKIRQPLVTSLMDQVQSVVSSTLNTDYQNYTKSIGSAQADSSLGVPYTSFTYLSKLIAKVQSQFNVTLVAGESPDYLADDQVGTFPGIGNAALASFITKEATNYLAQIDAKNATAAALLFRPSPPLQQSDAGNSIAFVRMTDALPSQRPASLDLMTQATVTNDLRTLAGFKMAQAEAAIDLAAANAGTLLIAAQASGHPIISLDSDSALSMETNDVKGIFPPLSDSAPSFMTQAFQLLSTYDPAKNPHPAKTIELPEQARLFVAQLTFVNATWNSESYFRDAFQASRMAGSNEQRMLTSSWFDYDSAVKRLDYVPKSTKN